VAAAAFSGVGLGIAFSGAAVPALVAYGGSRAAWAGMAFICAVALGVTGRWFTDDAPPATVAETGIDDPLPQYRTTFGWLLAVYTAEAFAYVVPATFLVAIVVQTPELSRYAALSWIVVGLTGAFATFPWIRAMARLGKAHALAVALGVQAIGIAAPVISRSPLAVILAAIALGGTFMAITLFAAGLGRDIFPQRTNSAMSRLTVFFSIGQILGPLVATQLALRFNSYDPALLVAAGVAALAAVVTFVAIREPGRVRPVAEPLR